MVVALTVTPALALLLLRGAPIERRKSPLVGWLQRGYTAGLSPDHRPARSRRTPTVAAADRRSASRCTRSSASRCSPPSRSATSSSTGSRRPARPPPRWSGPPPGSARNCCAIPGVQSVGAHIGQALLGEEVAGVNLGEIWVSLDAGRGLHATLDRIHDVANGYPGLFREVQTYLDERIEEVLTGGKEPIVVRIYGEDLQTLRAKSDEILRPGEVRARRDRRAPRHLHATCRRSKVTVNLAKAEKYGLKPGDVRRDAATLVAGEEVGDIFRAGKAYDVVVWSPERTGTASPTSRTCRSTRRRAATSGWARSPRWRCSRTPTPSTGRATPGTSTWARPWQGRDLGSVVNEIRQKLGSVQLARGYHVELLGEYQERQAAQSRLLESAVIAGAADPAAAAGLVPQLAAGPAGLPHPADGAGRRRAGGLAGGRDHLARVAGRLLHRVRHRRPQRDPADQPLPAPGRARRGWRSAATLVLRGARERLSPILMTSLATGLALVPLVVLGDAARARDRAPAGGGHPRRAGHLDAAQPVRAAVAVPAVRPPARGAAAAAPRLVLRKREGTRDVHQAAIAYLRGGAGRRVRGCWRAAGSPLAAAQPRPRTASAAAATQAAGHGTFTPSARGGQPDVPARGRHPVHLPGQDRARAGSPSRTASPSPSPTCPRWSTGCRRWWRWDRDFLEGKLQEQELAFFAQDDQGNVWNFGEYPEEYENGKFTGAPSTWIRGVDGAYGGIHMLSQPRAGHEVPGGAGPGDRVRRRLRGHPHRPADLPGGYLLPAGPGGRRDQPQRPHQRPSDQVLLAADRADPGRRARRGLRRSSSP